MRTLIAKPTPSSTYTHPIAFFEPAFPHRGKKTNYTYLIVKRLQIIYIFLVGTLNYPHIFHSYNIVIVSVPPDSRFTYITNNYETFEVS